MWRAVQLYHNFKLGRPRFAVCVPRLFVRLMTSFSVPVLL